MMTSKEKRENALLPLQALSAVGGDLKERFKDGKEYRRGESDLLGRDGIMLMRESVFQCRTVHKSFLLCTTHTGQCFSVAVNQLVYSLEDEAVLSSDKKMLSSFF